MLRFVVFFLVGLAPQLAVARERLVIRAVDMSGPEVATRATEVRNDFVGGIVAAGFDVVSDEDLKKELDQAPQLASCTSDVCLATVGRELGARWALAANIEILSASMVHVNARIVDAKTGKVAATIDKSCEGPCTWQENKVIVSSAGPSLRSQLEPLLALEAAATAPPPVQEGPSKMQWALRGAAIGAGVLGLTGFIIGGVEAARDGEAVCSGAFAGEYCALRRDAGTGVAFGFATGAIFLAASGVLAYFGWRHPHRPAVTATAGRTSLGWSF